MHSPEPRCWRLRHMAFGAKGPHPPFLCLPEDQPGSLFPGVRAGELGGSLLRALRGVSAGPRPGRSVMDRPLSHCSSPVSE